MALLLVEGFEGYGTSGDPYTYMMRRYASGDHSSTWYLQTGRYAGYSFQANGNYYVQTAALTTCDTVVFGCAYRWFTSSLSSTLYLMGLYDGATQGVNCRVSNYTGEVDVYRGSTLLGSTVGANIQHQWVYIEIKVKCHATDGTVEVRVNGVTKLSLTGQNTKAGTHTYHDVLRFYGSTYHYLDDIYYLDTTGASNNTFLGVQRVVGIFPNADTATEQWTPSAGSDHYALVDETKDNDDTDYVESTTSGQVDLWEYGNISGFSTVAGIQVNTTFKRTDATAYSLITEVVSGAATNDDTAVAATTSYVSKKRILDADPNTSSAWTQNGVNAVKCGVKIA